MAGNIEGYGSEPGTGAAVSLFSAESEWLVNVYLQS